MYLGAIIGDVVGSRFEFNNIKTKDFTLVTSESTPTDDSVLTLAVMDWCLHAKNKDDTKEAASFLQKWARAYPEAGYGGHFYHWKDLKDPQPYNSCGNGSAMRISAVGWYFDDLKEMTKYCNLITGVTHNHPEGLKGALVTATLIFMARHKASRAELYQYATKQYPIIKELDYDELVANYYHGAEICQDSVPQALYCFFISSSFEDCLRTTISIGGDCDTTSAISCAIAEAYYQDIPAKLANDVLATLTPKMRNLIQEAKDEYNNRHSL